MRLLDEIGHPNVGTFWQTKNRVGHEYRLEGLMALIDRVTNVHCHYYEEDIWPNIHFLSDGEADWSDYLEALNESGIERWISIERVKGSNAEGLRRDAATLKQWLSRD